MDVWHTWKKLFPEQLVRKNQKTKNKNQDADAVDAMHITDPL
jgi:hypothetical protein